MVAEFTNEQLDYVNSSIEDHTFLEACPGSGKTEIVAAKVAKEIGTWKNKSSGLAALSFANSATDELKIRVSKYNSSSSSIFPHFLGTFDSFIYKNIVSPLSTELTGYLGENNDASIRIVEPSANLGYKTQYSFAKRGHIHAHYYSFNLINGSVIFNTGKPELDRIFSSMTLKDWEYKDLFDTKIKMLQGGFATYRDIENLALDALSQTKYQHFVKLLVKRYPLIIIDECQDLSEEQLTILQILANRGTKLHFVGDLHQAIYGFRDVEPAKVNKFVNDNNFRKLQLTRNFRSCQNIVNLCAKLTGRVGIIGNVSWLKPRCVILQYNNCPTELTDTFNVLCNGFANNVIVARGHSVLRKFQTSIDQPNNIQKLALAIKLYNPKNMESLNQSLHYFSEFLRYHLKESYKPNSFNCPQSIESNFLWRKILNDTLNYLIRNNLQNLDISWSNWTTTAKSLIRTIPKQYFCPEGIASVLASLEAVNLTSPSGSAKLNVASSLGTAISPSLSYRKSTIHGAKGETHDITIVISSDRAGNDSHWKSWLNDPDSEAARFAYVASSRPKEFLIWAVKKLKPLEKKQLEAVGFKII